MRLISGWYFLLMLICFGACSGQMDGDSNADSITVPVQGDSITEQQPDTLPIEARLCEAFLDIANYIDSQGYVCDTSRLAKVYTELANNRRLYGRQHIFYTCQPEESCIADVDIHLFDSLIAMNREPVIEYFFTTTEKVNDYYIDGIIEQWELNDTANARRAAEQIVFTEMAFAHNAPPAVCYLDTRVYIFRSRSTPGMYALLPFFREFVARNNATTVWRENGWR